MPPNTGSANTEATASEYHQNLDANHLASDMASVFQLPRSTHDVSHLMQLPTEIKLVILRYLLIAPEGIGLSPMRRLEITANALTWDVRASSVALDDKPSVPSHHDIYPAILITCQELFTLGTHLLHQNNVLNVILVPMLQHTRRLCCTHQLMRQAEAIRPHDREYRLPINNTIEGYQAAQWQVLPPFKRIRLHIMRLEVWAYPGFYRFLQLAREEFNGKNVEVCFKGVDVQPTIRAFSLIRCEKIRFVARWFTLPPVTETVALVESNKPVIDLWAQYQEVLARLREANMEGLEDLEKLAGHMMLYQVLGFEATKAAIDARLDWHKRGKLMA